MTYLQNSLIAIGAPAASHIVDKCEADSDESPQLWSDDITSEVFVALQAAKALDVAPADDFAVASLTKNTVN